MAGVRLIVGLGNPGAEYADTRHNAGAVFVRRAASALGVELKVDAGFKGEFGVASAPDGHQVRLLIPTTFMNLSGDSVGAVLRYFKIELDELLVVHDEMAFPPGVAQLKRGGRDAGHNGLKDVIEKLSGDRDFWRLRIGVGHPGDAARVISYLTRQRPPQSERLEIERATQDALEVLGDLMNGEWQKAMNRLHAPGDGAADTTPGTLKGMTQGTSKGKWKRFWKRT